MCVCADAYMLKLVCSCFCADAYAYVSIMVFVIVDVLQVLYSVLGLQQAETCNFTRATQTFLSF